MKTKKKKRDPFYFRRLLLLIYLLLVVMSQTVWSEDGATTNATTEDLLGNCYHHCGELQKSCEQFYSDFSDQEMKARKSRCEIFFGEGGYCKNLCQVNSDQVFGACVDKNSILDDCIEDCDGHNAKCVLDCSVTHKNHEALAECWQSCTQTFSDEDSFCKFHCEDAMDDFMLCE